MKAIIFDLDDTLLWDRKSIVTALEKTAAFAEKVKGIDSKQLIRQVKNIAPEAYQQYDSFPFTRNIGINHFEGLWGEFTDVQPGFLKLFVAAPKYQFQVWSEALEACGQKDELFALQLRTYFRKMRLEHPFVYEETFHVLNKMQKNYKLALLTNGSPSLQKIKLKLTPEIRPYFSSVIISGEHGYGKPDVRIFEHVLEDLKVDASEAYMVGDNLYTDILGANDSDIQSIWINHDKLEAIDVEPTYEITQLKQLLDIVK